jgi:hypothetical protein
MLSPVRDSPTLKSKLKLLLLYQSQNTIPKLIEIEDEKLNRVRSKYYIKLQLLLWKNAEFMVKFKILLNENWKFIFRHFLILNHTN